jgi:transcriptional regulator with XRE-family HTH domain
MGLQKKIAYRLRSLREAAGLSQQDVAERAELSLSLVAKMEQGRKADPRASTLLALAGALDVRAGQLIEDLEKPPEDAFERKGKKGKKKKKKARELVAVGAPEGDAGYQIADAPPDAPADPVPADVPPAPPKRKRKKPE